MTPRERIEKLNIEEQSTRLLRRSAKASGQSHLALHFEQGLDLIRLERRELVDEDDKEFVRKLNASQTVGPLPVRIPQRYLVNPELPQEGQGSGLSLSIIRKYGKMGAAEKLSDERGVIKFPSSAKDETASAASPRKFFSSLYIRLKRRIFKFE